MATTTVTSLLAVCALFAGVGASPDSFRANQTDIQCWGQSLQWKLSCSGDPFTHINIFSVILAKLKPSVISSYCQHPVDLSHNDMCLFNDKKITKILKDKCQESNQCSYTLNKFWLGIFTCWRVQSDRLIIRVDYECLGGTSIPVVPISSHDIISNNEMTYNQAALYLSSPNYPLYTARNYETYRMCRLSFFPSAGMPNTVMFAYEVYELVGTGVKYRDTCSHTITFQTEFDKTLQTKVVCTGQNEPARRYVTMETTKTSDGIALYVEFRRQEDFAGRFWIKVEVVDAKEKLVSGKLGVACTNDKLPGERTITWNAQALKSPGWPSYYSDKYHSCVVTFQPKHGVPINSIQFTYKVNQVESRRDHGAKKAGYWYYIATAFYDEPESRWNTGKAYSAFSSPKWYRYSKNPTFYFQFQRDFYGAEGVYVIQFLAKSDTGDSLYGQFTSQCSKNELSLPTTPAPMPYTTRAPRPTQAPYLSMWTTTLKTPGYPAYINNATWTCAISYKNQVSLVAMNELQFKYEINRFESKKDEKRCNCYNFVVDVYNEKTHHMDSNKINSFVHSDWYTFQKAMKMEFKLSQMEPGAQTRLSVVLTVKAQYQPYKYYPGYFKTDYCHVTPPLVPYG